MLCGQLQDSPKSKDTMNHPAFNWLVHSALGTIKQHQRFNAQLVTSSFTWEVRDLWRVFFSIVISSDSQNFKEEFFLWKEPLSISLSLSIYFTVRLKLNILDNQPSVCPFCMMLIYYVLNWTGVTIKPREHEVDKLQSKVIQPECECPWPLVISRDGGVLGRHMPPLV